MDEADRAGNSSNFTPDPSTPRGSCLGIGLENLKRKFSFLSEYTDEFIKATGVDVLIKAETASRKLQKLDKERKAEDKLFQNREALSSSVSSVPSGPDNRLDVLHPARFLPGATCSAAKLWLQARSVMGVADPSLSPPTTWPASAWVAQCPQRGGSKFTTPPVRFCPSECSP